MNKVTKNIHWIILATLLMFGITLARVGTASPAETKIVVEPPEVKDLDPGTTFTVNITVTDIITNDYPGLYGWDVKLKFDSEILKVIEVIEGPFLKTINMTTWEMGLVLPKIDNSTGTITMGSTWLPPVPAAGATGSGTLASITFEVASRGRTSLRFEPKPKTDLYTIIPPNIKWDIPHTAVDGSFDNGAGIELSIELIMVIITAVTVCCAGVFFYVRRRRLGT